ncbi:C40 family peptidase [Salinicola aestuarinus]|uniref:C40 family peptidase n=1 Tax=Salinicola aestuarinus TaxID=1949082 RepID=UPI000DA19BCB|nr:C40 family peptidase [Salinicola aestuarinus]
MTCIGVAVAGLWTGIDTPRAVDAPALTAPVAMERWLAGLDDATRLALCREKRLATQALLDTPVTVIETATGTDGMAWSRVVVPSQPSSLDARGYPGWLPTAQLADAAGVARERESGDASGRVFVTAPTAWLQRVGGTPVKISFATQLALAAPVNAGDARVDVVTALGRGWLSRESVRLAETADPKDTATTLETMGRRFDGLRYLWAGNSGFGFDCSGFVHSLFAAVGVTLPRDAGDQVDTGTSVSLEARRAGDLLYFEKPDDAGRVQVDHVALYLGEDRILHAPTNNARIECRQLSGSCYARELCAVRRHLG